MRLITIIFALILFGCKEKVKISNEPIRFEDISLKDIDGIWCEINFPDTVYKNEKYNGEVLFISQLDTITTVFTDKQKDRYVIVNVLITDDVNYSHEYLKEQAKDIYGAIDNRHVPLDDLIFPNVGDYYIDAIVNDAVYIDLKKKNSEGEELLRLIEKEVRVTKKVVVIDK